MRRFLLIVLSYLIALCSCASSNHKLVAKVAAEVNYKTATYQHRCQGTGNPPAECKRCQEEINYGVWQAKVAEQNYEIGYLTPSQKMALNQLVLDLESCP